MSSDPAGWDAELVETGIAGTRFAGLVHHLPTVTSTNTIALEAAHAGYPEGHVWVADQQTAGRGRGGHTWYSAPRTGLYLSLLLRPDLPPTDALHLSLATALAVLAAVQEVVHLKADIRWPNDLLLGRKKFGGILVETAATPLHHASSTLRHAVVGIGLNIAQESFEDPLRHVATSLFLAGGGRILRRENIFAALLRTMDRELSLLGSPEGLLLQRFTAASSWVRGMPVHVGEDDGYTGTTAGLDSQGFLLVEDDAGRLRTVLSGGVRPR